MSRSQLGKYWIIFGCISLVLSGVLTLPILAGKVPSLKNLIPDIEWIRWCLVIHVNLSNLVWFTAIPVGIYHYAIAGEDWKTSQRSMLGLLGLIISIFGVLLMSTSFLRPGVETVLSNYLPVITSYQFGLGLILYFIGVIFNFISLQTIFPWAPAFSEKNIPGLRESRFGLWVGSLFFLMATTTLVFSYFDAKRVGYINSKVVYEMLMWGGGHLLQHTSAVFLVVVWVVLLTASFRQNIFSRSMLFPFFAWLGLPLFVIPIFLFWPIHSTEYREGFTWLMRWGIAPPVIGFLLLSLFRLKALNWPRLKDKTVFFGFFWSAILLLLGFVYGSFIRGADLRVPGHYHATIGAVTIGFITISARMILASISSVDAWLRRSIWTYGIGQCIFASGMFVAGSFGVPRKTYGSEIVLHNWGQRIGFSMLSIGGIIALIGGSLFAFTLFHAFLNRRKVDESKMDIAHCSSYGQPR